MTSGLERILADADAAATFPYAALDASMWEYYVAATATDPLDVSAMERDSRTEVATATLVAAEGPDGVGYFGRAATFEIAPGVMPDATPDIGRRTAETLRDRVQVAGRDLSVRVVSQQPILSGFERVMLDSGASVALEFAAEANLVLPEEQLWRSLRKSYRSLINSGKRELTIQLVDGAAPDRERFEVYRELHREVAGRVTRPAESWDVMYGMVVDGRAQLVLAYLEDRPVAATYLMMFGPIALYASGAYARDLGKFPVSHWPLYASMLEARRRGVTRLVLGAVFPHVGPASSAKERSIASFKLGFATSVSAWRTYGIGP